MIIGNQQVKITETFGVRHSLVVCHSAATSELAEGGPFVIDRASLVGAVIGLLRAFDNS